MGRGFNDKEQANGKVFLEELFWIQMSKEHGRKPLGKNLSSQIFPKSRDFDVWKSKNTTTVVVLAVDWMDFGKIREVRFFSERFSTMLLELVNSDFS